MAAPPLDPKDDTTIISLKLPAKLLARVRREAKRRGDDNVSLLIRSLLSRWLDEPRPPRKRKGNTRPQPAALP